MSDLIHRDPSPRPSSPRGAFFRATAAILFAVVLLFAVLRVALREVFATTYESLAPAPVQENCTNPFLAHRCRPPSEPDREAMFESAVGFDPVGPLLEQFLQFAASVLAFAPVPAVLVALGLFTAFILLTRA